MLDARSLGLCVEIKPILYCRGDLQQTYFVGDQWDSYLQDESFDDASQIFWCQKFKHWQPALWAVYGWLGVCHQAAAILVTIPAWSERRRHHNTAPPDESVQTGEDKD